MPMYDLALSTGRRGATAVLLLASLATACQAGIGLDDVGEAVQETAEY